MTRCKFPAGSVVYTSCVSIGAPPQPNERPGHSAPQRHVMLVNYFFPPMTGGGVARPVMLAKYLRQLGWTVTVVTVRAESADDFGLDIDGAADVVRAPEWRIGWFLGALGITLRFARRGWERLAARGPRPTTLVDRGFAYEEEEIEASKLGWVVPAVLAARRAHRVQPIDIAVVSIPPASSGTVGWLLRRLCGIPYLVEYRDPWTIGAFWTADADGTPRTDPITRARFALARRLEGALLRDSAGAIIVNGEVHVERLATAFPKQTLGKPIVNIRNGVETHVIATSSIGAPAEGDTLRLLHTGFFYHFYTPHHLITSLRLVQTRRPDVLDGVVLEFMGDGFPEQLIRQLEAWGLSALVTRTAAKSHSEARSSMHSADGLFAVLPPIDSDRDRLPTKLYEYLSTDRPILAVADPDGAVSDLLKGVPDALVGDNSDQAAVAEAFIAFVELAWKRRREGFPEANRRRGEIHHYSERATQMNTLLDQVLSSSADSAARYGASSKPG
jgi:Glycosyl transferase 4-like domain